ncbi:hypothetical protein [Alteraurantiacibacter aquimixticola]|uniref:Tetratricopeptide repeat protein n=1 Tax=Alteraurantiacibacter aquimixticola TaxID=2489173 RepID=A0A4T3F4F7_9SPHN|nr:hypothetical protein [Alteraurantiacibacter aquimixticola]TIX51214.1 hypothetical protein E5222_01715 [Alteraurantiacibacter aquimixticola]
MTIYFMPPLRVLLTAALVFLPAASLAAQEKGDVRWRDLPDNELGTKAQDFFANPTAAPCTEGMPAISELARRHPNTPAYGNMLILARMFCAMDEGRWETALDSLREVEAGGVPFDPFFGLSIATWAGDTEEVLRRLEAVVVHGAAPIDGPDAEQATSGALRLLFREHLHEKLRALSYRAFRAGSLDAMDTDYAANFASYAIKPAMENNPEDLPTLLSYMKQPQSYINLLQDREFEAIWPQLEERVGLHFRGVAAIDLAEKQSIFEADPGNSEGLRDYAYALYYAGRFADLLEQVTDWREAFNLDGEIDEHLGWAMNLAAYSADATGDPERADQFMVELAALDENIHPWVVNFTINHSIRLFEKGRYEEALAALGRAGEVADVHGSTYARMLVSEYRACSLQQLGRANEAEEEFVYLRDNAGDSYRVAAGGMLCLGKRDELVALLLEAMEDEDERREIARLMQREGYEFEYRPSKLPVIRDVILAEDALRVPLESEIRIVPDSLIPAPAWQWMTVRDGRIPDNEDSGGNIAN